MTPGRASTPLATSTANGCAPRSPRRRSRASRPPESTSGGRRDARAASSQSNARRCRRSCPARGRRAGGSRCWKARQRRARGARRSTRTAFITFSPVRRRASCAVGRALVAVQLQHRERHAVEQRRSTSSSGAFTNTPDHLDPAPQRGRDRRRVARARSGAGCPDGRSCRSPRRRLDRQRGVLEARDAANLHLGRSRAAIVERHRSGGARHGRGRLLRAAAGWIGALPGGCRASPSRSACSRRAQQLERHLVARLLRVDDLDHVVHRLDLLAVDRRRSRRRRARCSRRRA